MIIAYLKRRLQAGNYTETKNKVRDCLLGLAIGDALGVPFEFQGRKSMLQNPCTGMVGFGTHNQPPGTWSDDSALSFCLAEALTNGYDLSSIAMNFVQWLYEGFWTPRSVVFDVGLTTHMAIERLKNGISPEISGDTDEYSNGNGSLMRILPLLFFIADKPIRERFSLTRQVSSITHGHLRSVIACFIYLEYARNILSGQDGIGAYEELTRTFSEFVRSNTFLTVEAKSFSRLLSGDLVQVNAEHISSSGYVVHTLEAGLWCLIQTNSFAETVLKAVNLGDDNDTTAAVAGGLAGLLYGADSIPTGWLDMLARRQDIEDLARRFSGSIQSGSIQTLPATNSNKNVK
jgi:ADP-ribosyl-[dinitrogen reductase] hydrolase